MRLKDTWIEYSDLRVGDVRSDTGGLGVVERIDSYPGYVVVKYIDRNRPAVSAVTDKILVLRP